MYLALKLLHVLGVIVFLGNIITGIFWKAHADKSRDPRLIAHALDGIFDWAAYAKLSRAWGTWGAVSLITPLFAAALMVLKPVW